MSRHVTLICGPPVSGKTTLARSLAQPGDLILDLDVIAQQLGSGRRWRHNPELVAQAEECMTQALRRLARTDHITAYVIRCAPRAAQRAQLARAIRADVVHVLAPPMREVLARARRDGRPKGTATTIRQWYRRYAPSEVDGPVLDQGEPYRQALAYLDEQLRLAGFPRPLPITTASEVDSCPPEHPVPVPTRAAVASPASAPSTTP